MSKMNAFYDIAVSIRNERSLCFVAATRAKTELHIFTNDKLSPIFDLTNPYAQFDQYYVSHQSHYSDVGVFRRFTE